MGKSSVAIHDSTGEEAWTTQSDVDRVGEWYLSSQSAHRDQEVIGAYKQLQIETDELFEIITHGAGLNAVRVEFTRCLQPYDNDKELIAAVRSENTLEITSVVASGERRLHPVLDCDFGGAFDRFRATHDLIGHAWYGFGFDLADECAAWKSQNRLHSNLARLALATELLAVNAARHRLRAAPELKGLLLAPSNLGRICFT